MGRGEMGRRRRRRREGGGAMEWKTLAELRRWLAGQLALPTFAVLSHLVNIWTTTEIWATAMYFFAWKAGIANLNILWIFLAIFFFKLGQ